MTSLHAQPPPGGVQGGRACVHTCPAGWCHQLHPQGSSTYSLTHVPVRARAQGTCLEVDVDDGAVGASATGDGVVRQDGSEQQGSSVIREATATCELDVELHGPTPSSDNSSNNNTEAGISTG